MRLAVRWIKEQLIFIIIFFGLGFLVAWLLSFPSPDGWTLKKEVGVGDVINIVNALVITFLFTIYAQKLITDDRAEKTSLMSMCEQAQNFLNNCHTYYSELSNRYSATPLLPTDNTAMSLYRKEYSGIAARKTELGKCIADIKRLLDNYDYYNLNIGEVLNYYQKYEDTILSDSVSIGVFVEKEISEENYFYSELSFALHILSLEINRE